MTSERWQQVGEVFGSALDVHPADRTAYVRERCGDDLDLQQEVLRLVRLDDSAADFLEHPLFSFAADQAAAPATLLVTGDLVADRFRIVTLLGRGGMGEVYEAIDEVLHEPVALKAMRTDVGDAASMTGRFRREIQLARRITHPSACRVHDAAFHRAADGTSIIVLTMELLQGATLAARLRNGPLSADDALDIAGQLGAALDAAHSCGVLHRDVKPTNVMLEPRGSGVRAVLTDFGLARAVEAGTPGVTRPSVVIGTPEYLAPEQLRGEPPTPRSDLYSFALLIYEMVSGVRPHAAQLAGRLVAAPPPVRTHRPDLDGRWDATLTRALDPDPARRFASASELMAHLAAKPTAAGPAAFSGWWRPRILLPVATGAAIVAALFVLGLRLTSTGTAIVPPAAQVLLSDVINGTGDADLDSTTELLRTQLAQSPRFELVPGDRIRAALQRMRRDMPAMREPEVAREVAMREGAPIVTFGTVTRLASDYVVTIKLERIGAHPSSPSGAWQESFVASSKGRVFDAVDEAAKWVRETIGESPAGVANYARPPRDTTTTSWDALRLYARAERTAAEGRATDAALLLEQALQFDPNFATAHRRLGDLLLSQRRDREAVLAWQQAIRLVDQQQLTTRESLRIRAQYLEDTGDLPGAEKAYRTYLVHYPNDFAPALFLGSVLVDSGRTAEAVPWFEKAARLRPRDFVAPTHLTRALLDLGHKESAAAQIKVLRTLGAVEWATWLEGLTRFVEGDLHGALAVVEPLRTSADPQWVSRAYSVRASWLADTGATDRAAAELSAGIAFDEARGFRERQADKWLFVATLQCDKGQADACAESCARALATAATPQRAMRAGTLLARTGRVREAEQLLTHFEGQPDVPRVRAARQRLRGEIEAARGRSGVAASLLREGATLSRARYERIYLSRALRASGDPENARRALEDFIAHPVRAYLTPEPEFPGIWAAALREYIAALESGGRDATEYRQRYHALRHPGPASVPVPSTTKIGG